MFWIAIFLDGHTDLHVFHGETVTAEIYRDQTLDAYVRPYVAAIGDDFILMDHNAQPYRDKLVDKYLEDQGMELNGLGNSISGS